MLLTTDWLRCSLFVYQAVGRLFFSKVTAKCCQTFVATGFDSSCLLGDVVLICFTRIEHLWEVYMLACFGLPGTSVANY